MAKKKVLSKKKIARFILILVAFILIIFLIVNTFNKKTTKVKQKEIKIEEEISKYNYQLNENETSYYKSLFKQLKKVLNEKNVNEEKYASLISQLFLADFFNLDNKISKSDIGGIQYIYKDYQNDFEKFAKESIYHYIESNIYGDRKQKLPKVSEVSILNIENIKYTYFEKIDSKAFKVDAKIIYEENLGYQEKATIYIIHNNNRLEITKMTK